MRRRLAQRLKEADRPSAPHILGWGLVFWEGGRGLIFSQSPNAGVLAMAALLLGTETHARRRKRQSTKSSKRSKRSGPHGS